jgi:hypothetical protein
VTNCYLFEDFVTIDDVSLERLFEMYPSGSKVKNQKREISGPYGYDYEDGHLKIINFPALVSTGRCGLLVGFLHRILRSIS